MSSIVDLLREKKYFACERSVSLEDIENAERGLGLTFAKDYREYVQECGTASFEGHELTGISKDLNLDVVSVTKNALSQNPRIDTPLYVIEETHIDGIVIWQAPDKKVYRTDMGTEPIKIAESLADYINMSAVSVQA